MPMAVEGGRLGVGDEDPIDAEAELEALEVGELEVGPAGLGLSLLFPEGAELGDFGDDRGVFDGVSEGASLGKGAEAVIVLAWGFEVMGIEGEVGIGGCVVLDPVEGLEPGIGGN